MAKKKSSPPSRATRARKGPSQAKVTHSALHKIMTGSSYWLLTPAERARLRELTELAAVAAGVKQEEENDV